MSRRDAAGNVLYRNIDVRIIYPEGRKDEHTVLKPGPHKGYSAERIDEIFDDIIDKLDTRFPRWNFRMVRRGMNGVTFVYDGLRELAPPTKDNVDLLVESYKEGAH